MSCYHSLKVFWVWDRRVVSSMEIICLYSYIGIDARGYVAIDVILSITGHFYQWWRYPCGPCRLRGRCWEIVLCGFSNQNRMTWDLINGCKIIRGGRRTEWRILFWTLCTGKRNKRFVIGVYCTNCLRTERHLVDKPSIAIEFWGAWISSYTKFCGYRALWCFHWLLRRTIHSNWVVNCSRW